MVRYSSVCGMRSIRKRRSLLIGLFGLIGTMSHAGIAYAHFGVDDGHTAGFAVPVLLGLIAVVGLMLYLAFSQKQEEEERKRQPHLQSHFESNLESHLDD